MRRLQVKPHPKIDRLVAIKFFLHSLTPQNEVQPGQPPVTNDTHAEYKILNALAVRLQAYCAEKGVSPADLEGTVHLYTELQMCPGCRYTAMGETDSFRSAFPKLHLLVFWRDTYPR